MRHVVLSVAAAGLAFVAGCGGSSSSATSPADGGTEAGIIRRLDGGNGMKGVDAGAGFVPPIGTLVFPFASAYLEGVTDDGYAVFQDTIGGGLYAVSIHSPSALPTTITKQATDYGAGVVVDGTTVLMLSGSSPTAKVGALTTWTSASGTKAVSPLSTLALFGLSSDFTTLAFYDNVTETGGTLQTGDLTVSHIDGTAKQALATGVTLAGGNCLLQGAQIAFVGTDLFALSCTPPGDGGAAGEDAGDAGPAGPTATITRYPGPAFGPSRIVSSDVTSTGFGTDRANGMPGSELLFSTSAGWVVYPMSGAGTVVAPDAVTAALSTDGSQVLYVTSSQNVVDAPVASPQNSTILTSGAFTNFIGESPDPKSSFALLATTVIDDPLTGFPQSSDLNLLSTTAPNTALAVTTSDTAALYGQGFTADSKFTVFDDNVLGGVGTIYAQATDGSGMPMKLGDNSWIDDEPTGSLVLFNVNCVACTTMYVPGTADIKVIDLSKSMAPTTLVTQADYYFYLTKDKSKLVYSWHPTMGEPATATTFKAGIWVWPLP